MRITSNHHHVRITQTCWHFCTNVSPCERCNLYCSYCPFCKQHSFGYNQCVLVCKVAHTPIVALIFRHIRNFQLLFIFPPPPFEHAHFYISSRIWSCWFDSISEFLTDVLFTASIVFQIDMYSLHCRYYHDLFRMGLGLPPSPPFAGVPAQARVATAPPPSPNNGASFDTRIDVSTRAVQHKGVFNDR